MAEMRAVLFSDISLDSQEKTFILFHSHIFTAPVIPNQNSYLNENSVL